MRTVSDILAELNQAIGHDLTPGHDLTHDINEAGAYLYASHDWTWLNATAVLSQVADRSWSELPRDFGHMPRLRGHQNAPIVLVSMDELVAMRLANATTGMGFYAAIADGILDPADTGVPAKRLEWYPTPSTSGNAGIVQYKRTFRQVTAADASVPIAVAEELLGAFCRLARASAMRRESMIDQAAAEQAAALEELTTFIDRDMRSRLNFGPAMGGADRFARHAPPGGVRTAGVFVDFGA